MYILLFISFAPFYGSLSSTNKSLQDKIPELNETLLVNITHVELVDVSVIAGQPSINRPGLEVAEIIIQENDDPRGVLEFNVTKVIVFIV